MCGVKSVPYTNRKHHLSDEAWWREHQDLGFVLLPKGLDSLPLIKENEFATVEVG